MKDSHEYKMISQHYGDKTAKRSGVRLMNHIDEGLIILEAIDASDDAMRAYCMHPIFQSDADLAENFEEYEGSIFLDATVMILTMEYRSVANAYLSTRKIESIDEIRLSPLKDVNDMLIADKIQNYKDFMKYHHGTHPRSEELYEYFHNWFKRLGVDFEDFKDKI